MVHCRYGRGGKLNVARTGVDFVYDPAQDNAADDSKIRVPLVVNWVSFGVAQPNQRAPLVKLHFKPQGSLLKVKVFNKIPLDRKNNPTKINVDLNLASSQLQGGTFDFSLGSGAPTDPKKLPYQFTNPTPLQVSSAVVSVGKFGEGDAMVVWGMWGIRCISWDSYPKR